MPFMEIVKLVQARKNGSKNGEPTLTSSTSVYHKDIEKTNQSDEFSKLQRRWDQNRSFKQTR